MGELTALPQPRSHFAGLRGPISKRRGNGANYVWWDKKVRRGREGWNDLITAVKIR